jgi:hypothetical protein
MTACASFREGRKEEAAHQALHTLRSALCINRYYQSTLTLANLFSGAAQELHADSLTKPSVSLVSFCLAGMIIWDEIVVQTPTSLLFFAVGCSTTVCGQLVLLTKVHSPTEELVDASATAPGEEEEDGIDTLENIAAADAAALSDQAVTEVVVVPTEVASASEPQESDCIVRRGDGGETSRLLRQPAPPQKQQQLLLPSSGTTGSTSSPSVSTAASTSSALLLPSGAGSRLQPLLATPVRSLLAQLSAMAGMWPQWLDARAGSESLNSASAPPT